MSLQRLDTTKEAVLQGGDYEIQSMRVVPDTALYNENQTIKRQLADTQKQLDQQTQTLEDNFKVQFQIKQLENYNQKLVKRLGLLFVNQQDLIKQFTSQSQILQEVELENIRLRENEQSMRKTLEECQNGLEIQSNEINMLKMRLKKKQQKLQQIADQLVRARNQIEIQQQEQSSGTKELKRQIQQQETKLQDLQAPFNKGSVMNSQENYFLIQMRYQLQSLKDGQFLMVNDENLDIREIKQIINKLLKNMYKLRRNKHQKGGLNYALTLFNKMFDQFIMRGEILCKLNNGRKQGLPVRRFRIRVLMVLAVIRMRYHRQFKFYKSVNINQIIFVDDANKINQKNIIEILCGQILQMKEIDICNDIEWIKAIVSKELNIQSASLIQEIEMQREQFNQINLAKDIMILKKEQREGQLDEAIVRIRKEMELVKEENERLKGCQNYLINEIKQNQQGQTGMVDERVLKTLANQVYSQEEKMKYISDYLQDILKVQQ